ncbi:helix-turn-helix domain-containing protein [Pseudoroseomonas wenyumeiae]
MKHVDMRSLAPEAQEERRRQVIGLRQAGQTYAAIAAQVGLTLTGVFDICKRFAARGRAGLKSRARGPAPGHGSLLAEEQEAEVQALISQQMPDELGLPFALWSRAAVQGKRRLTPWLRYTALGRRIEPSGERAGSGRGSGREHGGEHSYE